MSTSLLELRDVSRFFSEHCAVDNLSLTLNKGEVIGLLGLNGAGKSTSLKMLSGLLAPSFGHVLLNGVDIQDQQFKANTRIGYLPEQPPLYLHQRVDEYLAGIAKLYGLNAEKTKERIATVKQQCGLEAVSKRIIGNLSKGYQQRVGIAQAILHEPEIIILDEPTVGLDPQQLLKVRDLVKELSKNACVIFSSHMLAEVQAIADRIVIIHQGKLVHDKKNDGQANLETLFSDVIFGRINSSPSGVEGSLT